MSLDLVDKCESSSLKTHAVNLLHAIEFGVDGMATFMVDFCLQFLRNTMGSENSNQEYVYNIIQKFKLNFSNEEDIIEVCLMLLTIMKDSIE